MTHTHFGFQEIPVEEKQSLVRGVFDSVAARYDVMNDLMSFGMHRLWKQEMIGALNPREVRHLLDVAGGTGDIAFRFKERSPGRVTICDINERMVREGRNRAINRNRLSSIDWVCGNAEALPLPDQSVDAYTIAFGIRNVTDIPAALREAARVLKPGGRFLCLEFSQVQAEPLRALYDRYSFSVIPMMGKLVAGDADPYQYLVESIRRFPAQEEFARMIREAGLGNVSYRNLSGGVVALHSGWRL